MLNLTSSRGRTRVDMTYEDLQKMIRTLLEVVEFDELYYLSRYPDVATGIRQGHIGSAREHFVDHGYFEGRLAYRIEVDEKWYAENHPDLAHSIGTDEYSTGQDHFDGLGYSEGRQPFPPNR